MELSFSSQFGNVKTIDFMACVVWKKFIRQQKYNRLKRINFYCPSNCGELILKLDFTLLSFPFLYSLLVCGICGLHLQWNNEGFGALAALKRKRKKFSKSRNTSPVLEPSTPSKVESPSKKVSSTFGRTKLKPTSFHLTVSQTIYLLSSTNWLRKLSFLLFDFFLHCLKQKKF